MNLTKMVKNFMNEIHSQKIEPCRRSRFSYAKTYVREDDYITIITLNFDVLRFLCCPCLKKTKYVA